MREHAMIGILGGTFGILAGTFLLALTHIFSVWNLEVNMNTELVLIGIVASVVGMFLTTLDEKIYLGFGTIASGGAAFFFMGYFGLPTLAFFAIAGLLVIREASMKEIKS